MRIRFRVLLITGLALTLLASSASFAFGAAKTKKMTVYDEVIKSGRYLYCCDSFQIYRYDLKTGTSLRLVDRTAYPDEGYHSMKKKGHYLYCLFSTPDERDFYLLRTNTRKQKRINSKLMYGTQYCISKNRLYYSGLDLRERTMRRSAKLNGDSQKKSNVVCEIKNKKSNVKGYRVIVKDDYKGHVRSWIKLPNGKKVKLGECTYPYTPYY